MTHHFNDSPIEKLDDDRFGILPFAKALAESIRSMESPVGTTIAINGPWGSGKSSAINLIREKLNETKDEKLIISEFKCWWFRGEDALLLAFLNHLNALLSTETESKAKEALKEIGKILLQATPILTNVIAATPMSPAAPIVQASADVMTNFLSETNTAEKIYQNLYDILKKIDFKILIIVDDIDRLHSNEAIAVFRIIKSIGRLPNIIYLLAFDRNIAESAIKEIYPSEPPHFLEKIVQASFDIPPHQRFDILNFILEGSVAAFGETDTYKIENLAITIRDTIYPYIVTPRHAVRLKNIIQITYPPVRNEVDVADFLMLETIRLFDNTLYRNIQINKSLLVGGFFSTEHFSPKRSERTLSKLLDGIEEKNIYRAKISLIRLFPRLSSREYPPEWHAQWRKDRKICSKYHFDTYFRFSLSEDTLSSRDIEQFIENISDTNFVKKTFHEMASARRRDGKSMIHIFLDELGTQCKNISDNDIVPFLKTIFEIHDIIDNISKTDFDDIFINFSTQIHWFIRNLTFHRFDLNERTDIFRNALQTSSLGWRVSFVRNVQVHYRGTPDQKGSSDGEPLVSENVLDELIQDALCAIKDAARDGSLLHHCDLISILYHWRDFADGDATEPRAWTDSLLEEDDALVVFAKGFTGVAQIVSSRVPGAIGTTTRIELRAQINDDTGIIDAPRFRKNLTVLQSSGRLTQEDQDAIDNFLAAWDRKDRGEYI